MLSFNLSCTIQISLSFSLLNFNDILGFYIDV